MVTVNRNYLKLPGSYLFSTIAGKVSAFQKENPEARILRLGIGDVTQPLAPGFLQGTSEDSCSLPRRHFLLFPELWRKKPRQNLQLPVSGEQHTA